MFLLSSCTVIWAKLPEIKKMIMHSTRLTVEKRSIRNVWFVCSKVRDVFNTIDTAASGRLSFQDVSIPLHSVLCFIV